MKKFFSFFAAVLFAGSMMADVNIVAPIISGDSTFTDSVIITMSCPSPDADIYYTTDGTTDPKCDCSAAPEYKKPFVIKETTTIKAAAYDGNDWSAVSERVFTKVEPQKVYTVAEAYAMGMELDSAGVSEKEYTVEGYVINPFDFSVKYMNQSWYMADSASALASDFQAYNCFPIEGADTLKVLAGDKVSLTGKLTKFWNKKQSKYIIEIVKGNATFIEKVEGDHTAVPVPATIDTLTATAAADAALAGKTDEVYVKGYVTEIAAAFSAQYKNVSFWVADSLGGGNVFQVFRAVCEKEEDAPIAGDLILAKGKLTDYFNKKDSTHTPELAAGCTYEFLEKAERPEPKPEPEFVIADTLSVIEAIRMGMALDSAATDSVVYAVEGYVINPGAFSMLYHNQSWYMADSDSAETSDFQAYNCYPIDGNDTLKVLAGDKVYVVGKLKKYYNKSTAKYIIEIERGNAEFISKVDGDHSVVVKTQEITIAKALEIGAALADNASTEEMYIMTGYVSAINVKASDAWSDNYKNQSFWVTDEAGSTASTNADGAFYVYRGKPETEAEIPVGTKVQFTATIKKYVPSGGGDPVIENADQNIVIRILGDTQAEPDVFFAETDFAGMGRAATLETPGDTVKLTKGGVTFFCDNAYGTDKYGVRCYKGATVSISVEDTTIAKIVFDLYSTYTGGLDAEVVVNGKEWKVVDLPSQARMTTIKVYYGHAEEIEIEEINIAEAMEIGGKLEDNAYTDKKYAVVGYVINAKNYGEKYEGKQTFYMSDEASAEKGEFTAYNCAVETPGVAAGDKVRVIGKIQKYVGASGTPTIEITGGDVEIMWRQGIENIVLTEKAQKVVVDGVLYIIRDNKMFNIQGIQVR